MPTLALRRRSRPAGRLVLAIACAGLALTSCSNRTSSSRATPTPTIVERPIQYGEERTRLTIDYRREHQDPAADDVEIDPQVIVLHHTGKPTREASWGYFDPPTIDNSRPNVTAAGAVNVSAHFLVDRDGTIERLVPETRMARHCIGLNHVAIGVENVGDGDAHPLTDAQVAANVALVRHLASRFPITHVIGHFEYRRMERHPLWLERDPGYRTEKFDPGPEFMARVRAGIADLGLEGPPAGG